MTLILRTRFAGECHLDQLHHNRHPLITPHHLIQNSSLTVSRDVILPDEPSFPFDYAEDVMF